jgi:hypothetical protein
MWTGIHNLRQLQQQPASSQHPASQPTSQPASKQASKPQCADMNRDTSCCCCWCRIINNTVSFFSFCFLACFLSRFSSMPVAAAVLCDVVVSTNNNNYYNYSGCTFAMNKITFLSTKKDKKDDDTPNQTKPNQTKKETKSHSLPLSLSLSLSLSQSLFSFFLLNYLFIYFIKNNLSLFLSMLNLIPVGIGILGELFWNPLILKTISKNNYLFHFILFNNNFLKFIYLFL